MLIDIYQMKLKKIYINLKKINKKPIVPKQEEIKINIRSRLG